MKNLRLDAVVPLVADMTSAAELADPSVEGAPVPETVVLLTVAVHVPSPLDRIVQSYTTHADMVTPVVVVVTALPSATVANISPATTLKPIALSVVWRFWTVVRDDGNPR